MRTISNRATCKHTTKRYPSDLIGVQWRPKPSNPAPSAAEATAIIAAIANVRGRNPRFSITIDKDAEGHIAQIGPDHNDRNGWLARIENAFGTRGTAFALSQLNILIRACQHDGEKIDNNKLNAMLAVIDGAKLENEIQAMPDYAGRKSISSAVACD